MARYRKLDLRTWSDLKFRELSPLPPSGQSLWLYMVLGPQTTNIPGLFEATEITMIDRLGWTLEAFREAFAEASSKGMAKADWTARLVWLPNAPKYNKPESPNVVISWGNIFDELPECALKHEAYRQLKAFAKEWGEPYLKAFQQAFPQGYAESVAVTVAVTRAGTRTDARAREQSRSASDTNRDSRSFDPQADSAAFALVKASYPKFAGRQNWIQAEHYCHLRLDDGATWDELIAGAERYAKHIRAIGKEGTQHVIRPENFFNAPDRPWSQEWVLPDAQPANGNGSKSTRRLTPGEIIEQAIHDGLTDEQIFDMPELDEWPTKLRDIREKREEIDNARH